MVSHAVKTVYKPLKGTSTLCARSLSSRPVCKFSHRFGRPSLILTNKSHPCLEGGGLLRIGLLVCGWGWRYAAAASVSYPPPVWSPHPTPAGVSRPWVWGGTMRFQWKSGRVHWLQSHGLHPGSLVALWHGSVWTIEFPVESDSGVTSQGIFEIVSHDAAAKSDFCSTWWGEPNLTLQTHWLILDNVISHCEMPEKQLMKKQRYAKGNSIIIPFNMYIY